MSLSRGWVFTLNNYSEEEEVRALALPEEVKYGVIGKEVGESGTPHFQGYIYFKTEKSLKQVREIFDRAHWEISKGSIDEASDYCKKDGDFFEFGDKPMSNKRKGDAGKQSIEERWDLAKRGKFEELPPEMIKTYEYIYRKSIVVEDRDELDNVWIWGPSGCGKSRYVRDNHEVFYTKGMNKWWDGYNGEEIVLLDDFDPKHGEFLGYFLKIWADHYAFNAEVKGGMLKIRPKKIIVTSQYPIESCFKEQEEIDAINRRFKTLQLGSLSQYSANFNH